MTINPALPTTAGPGTEAKILVMIARARLQLPLFHPLDSAELNLDESAAATAKRAAKAFRRSPLKRRDLPPCVYHFGTAQFRVLVCAGKGKRKHLGVFDSVEEAVEAVRRHYGEDDAA